MTQIQQAHPTSKHVLLAALGCGLVVYGIFTASTAYGSWSSWLLAVTVSALGAVVFVSVARVHAHQRGWTHLPAWLMLLAGVVVASAISFGLLGAVCGSESGFSCGG